MIAGMVTCGGVFNWVYTLEPTAIWKPMSGHGPGAGFMIGCFVLNVILSIVYALLKNGVPGKNKYFKGLVFGLCVWAVGMLPGMHVTYAFMTVSTTVVVYWTILGFVQTPLEGLIIAAIYGE